LHHQLYQPLGQEIWQHYSAFSILFSSQYHLADILNTLKFEFKEDKRTGKNVEFPKYCSV
jgi:hypothetical protein